MSSEILTDTVRVRLKPDTTEANQVRLKPDTTGDRRPHQTNSSGVQTDDGRVRGQAHQGLEPWQFFVLAALGLATAVMFTVSGQGVIPIVMLSVLLGTAALAGLAALRLVRPLVSDHEDRTAMIGERTRAALEREKLLALRAIKELDFDRAMGKLSESDWKEMSGRLRTRAARLIRQLDAGSGYRAQIERDVAKRLAADARSAKASAERPSGSDDDTRLKDSRSDDAGSVKVSAARVCAACSTENDSDARYCKQCGQKV
jgi:hypothetical protein